MGHLYRSPRCRSQPLLFSAAAAFTSFLCVGGSFFEGFHVPFSRSLAAARVACTQETPGHRCGFMLRTGWWDQRAVTARCHAVRLTEVSSAPLPAENAGPNNKLAPQQLLDT
jgi:hypothetical protein